MKTGDQQRVHHRSAEYQKQANPSRAACGPGNDQPQPGYQTGPAVSDQEKKDFALLAGRESPRWHNVSIAYSSRLGFDPGGNTNAVRKFPSSDTDLPAKHTPSGIAGRADPNAGTGQEEDH